MLPSVVPSLATKSAVRVFPGVWKLLSFLRLPSRGQSSVPTSFVSLFVFYIFSYLLLKTSPSSEYSLEGLMMELKLQYFGHLIQSQLI